MKIDDIVEALASLSESIATFLNEERMKYGEKCIYNKRSFKLCGILYPLKVSVLDALAAIDAVLCTTLSTEGDENE